MTKEEIIALIDAKIAGQGTNIDAGSALPEILKGILDLAGGETLVIPGEIPVGTKSIQEIAAGLGITETQFDRALHGKYDTIVYKNIVLKLSWVREPDSAYPDAFYGGAIPRGVGYAVHFLCDGDGGYEGNFWEM